MTPPPFGEDVIRALATEESFARGKRYFRSGAVFELVRRGDVVTAQVEGSEFAPYDVTVRLREGGVAETRCSCPYDWGGACKHVVAVLLKFVVKPGEVVERLPLADMLRDLDRAALAALLVKRAESDPGLVLWLEAELAVAAPDEFSAGPRRTTVDPEPIRRQAEALLSGRNSRRRGWSDDIPAVDEDGVAALIDKARPFIEAGDGRNALAILGPVTEALVPAWREQADWDETLHEFFPELGQLIAESVLMGDLAPGERDDLMARLDVCQGELDEYGLDDYLQVAIDALEQGWDELGLEDVMAGRGNTWPLSGDGDRRGQSDWTTEQLTEARLRVLDIGGRTEAFLNLASAAGRHEGHAAMLVRLGRIAEAVAYARKRFRAAEEVLQFSRVLWQSEQIDAALDLAAWGLSLKADDDRLHGVVGLARWLRDCAGALGRKEPALMAAAAAFEHSLSLDDFRAAETSAGSEWAKLRARLLGKLAAARYAHDRTEIFLNEGMIDEAVRSVDVENTLRNPMNKVLLRLAEAAHASHPDWVIDCCERMAANVMDSGQAGFYDLAAQWLEKAALAYDAAGRFDDWMTRIDKLIEKHRRKYKLKPLLQALRPGA